MSAPYLLGRQDRRSLNALAIVLLGLSNLAWGAANAQVKERVVQPAKVQAKIAGDTAKPPNPRESVSSSDEFQPKGSAELGGSDGEDATIRLSPEDLSDASARNTPVNNDEQQAEGWRRYLQLKYLFVFFGVALVVAVIFYIWLPGRNRSGAGADGRGSNRMTGPGGSSSRRDGFYVPNPDRQTSMEVERLYKSMNMLAEEFEQLKRQVKLLEAKVDGRPIIESAKSASGSSYPTLDRRDSRVFLPEDERRPATNPSTSYPSELKTAAAPDRPSSQAMQNDQILVNRYNDAVKPNEIADLASELGAQFYTNERSGDISNLLKSEVDRFWLVPMPGQPDTAWLLPGFTLRKSWQKYRQFVSDHPLAHHFNLLQGDKFIVNRAAVVRKDVSGEWLLVSKGEVSGIS